MPKKRLVFVRLLVWVRQGGVQVKVVSHLAPLVHKGRRVALRDLERDFSLGFMPSK